MARKAGAGISFTLLGRKPIDRAFRELPERLAKKVIRSAMRKGMKVVAKQVRANTPRDTGATRKAVKTRAAKLGRRGLGIDVRIGEGDYKGDTFAAAFVEYGTVRRVVEKTGQRAGRVKARRFMRRAYKQKRREARRITDREILAGIIREAKALADKGQPS